MTILYLLRFHIELFPFLKIKYCKVNFEKRKSNNYCMNKVSKIQELKLILKNKIKTDIR